MNPTNALLLAQNLSLAAFATFACWHAAPWLKARPRADALLALVWVHAFRSLALQLYASQQAGLVISDAARDHAVAGDLLGLLLALAALFALRYRAPFAAALVWLLVAETLLDIGVGTAEGIRDQALAHLNGITWLILAYYVPLMLVALGLTVWQLVSRRREPLAASSVR